MTRPALTPDRGRARGVVHAVVAAALAVAGAVPFAAGQQGAPAEPRPAGDPAEPIPTDVEESVTVVLAELQILVTDKSGAPITDLRPDEVEVREGRQTRRLAFLEPFATTDLAPRISAQPTPLEYTAPSGDEPAAEAEVVPIPPPPAIRRIVLLFDAYNSRTPDRRRWVEAARKWVASDLRPDDRVAIAVFDGEVRIVVPFTGRKESLLSALTNPSFLDASPYQDVTMDVRRLLEDLQTCIEAYDKASCASSAVQTYIYDWRVRAERTMRALRRFAASLAAIPGRKAVLYMSDGIVPQPGETATQAVLATFGTDVIDYRRLRAQLRRDERDEILAALDVAAGSDVTFFTFDTRPAGLRESGWDAEQRYALHERQVADPYAYAFDETRGSLDTIAIQTGGRSYHGRNIDENLPLAARAIEGLYTVGFYRDARSRPGRGRVKVRIARRGVRVSYPDRFDPRRKRPLTLPLELAAGKPQAVEGGFLVPLFLQAPLSELDFREEGRRYLAELALYAEAVSVTGVRAADAYEMVELPLDRDQHQARAGKRFGHRIGLIVPPGAYRVRARVADASFRRAAERAIDITITARGELLAGLHPDRIQESVHTQDSGRVEVVPAVSRGDQNDIN